MPDLRFTIRQNKQNPPQFLRCDGFLLLPQEHQACFARLMVRASMQRLKSGSSTFKR